MCSAHSLRTTLELDDDLLTEARQLARQRAVSPGQMISDPDLARQSLGRQQPPKVRNGMLLFVPEAAESIPAGAIRGAHV